MKKLNLLFAFCLLFIGIAKADIEPGNNAFGSTPDVLPMGGSQSGQNGPGDNDDYYQLTSGADGNISVSLTNITNEYAYIYLINSDGTNQVGTTQGNAQAGITFTSNGLAAGNYYVRVYSTSLQSYTITASLATLTEANDVEPNNSIATALAYTVNSTVTGHIAYYGNNNTYDTDDFYVFNTASDGDISVSITNNNNNYIYIYLYDNDGVNVLGATQGNAQSTISLTTTGLASGTYYIRVYASGGSYSGYTLNASLSSNPYPNDGVANNFFNTAPSFAQNDSIKGHIAYRSNGGSYDFNDYFSFYSNGDYDITISLTNNNNNYTYIYLYDTDTVTQLGASQGNAQGGISFTTTGLAAGTYFIRVYAGGGSYSGYTLKNTYTADAIVNDVEPNNTSLQASSTAYNSTNTGHIAYRQTGGNYDTDDYYVFNTPADGNISLSLTNTNNNYSYIYLYDSDGATQLGANQGNAQGGISFTSNGLNAGTYYARVYAGAGSYSGYTLTKSFTATPNTNDAEPNGSMATALTFNPNSSVTGHIAHRLNGGAYDNYDYYKLVTTADGNISLSLTNDNNNYIYVYLYDSDGATQLTANQGSGLTTLTCSASGLAAGTYYAVVYTGAGSYSGYTLTNTFATAAFNNDVEANNTFGTASVLNNNASKQGHIAYRFNGGAYDNYDYWKISMLQTDSMRLDLTMANTNYSYVYFYDGAQNQIYANQGGNTSYSIFFNSLPAGDYYLLVYAGVGSFNSYSIDHFYYPCNTSASAITAGGSTTFCQPGSVALNSVSAYASYLWSNGATTGSINATSSGTYTLTASDNDACPHTSNSINVNAVPAPTPSITPQSSTTFCAGGSVTLDAGSYSSYSWSTGATSQTITVSANGTFTVTVTDATGCSGTSAPVTVTVTATGTPTISPSGATTFCAGGNVTLTATAGSSYLWSNAETTQSIVVSSNGTFTVDVTGAGGCSGTSAPLTVTVNPLPSVTLGSFANSCDTDAPFALTGGSPSGGTYSGTGVSGGNFDPSAAGVGTHTITYSYTNGNGCSNFATSTINVTPCGCNVTQADAGLDILVCSSNTVTLNGNTPSVGTGNWTVISSSGGVISQHGNPNTQFSGIYNRTYILRWTISSPGCPSTTDDVKVFFMNNSYTVPKPAKINGASNGICGTTQTYSVPAINVFATYTWTGWPTGTIINSQTGSSINVTFPASGVGTFHINAYATMCSKNGAVAALVVTGGPSQQTISGPSVVCASTNGVIFSVPSAPGINYNWKVPTGSSIVSGQGTHLVHVNWGASGGKVQCTISNACGNSTCVLNITTNCREQGASDESLISSSVVVFPNPSSGVFTIQSLKWNGNNGVMTVTDLQGRIILKRTFSGESNTSQVDLSSFQSGMYLLEMKADHFYFTTRLIKKD